MISLFRKKEKYSTQNNFLIVDIHSHLLPGIDDGCQNIHESIACVDTLIKAGYKKLIITPHIIEGYYNNTPEIISEKLQLLRKELIEREIDIQIEAAAEYYLDEYFIALLANNQPLLTFGRKYVLIELGFYNEPVGFTTTLFNLLANGYRPVLAHPERYLYLYSQFDKVRDWVGKGLLLQINLLSLIGYYSPAAQSFTEKLIDEGLVSFAGTDAHNTKHLQLLPQIYNSKYFLKLASNKLINNTLL